MCTKMTDHVKQAAVGNFLPALAEWADLPWDRKLSGKGVRAAQCRSTSSGATTLKEGKGGTLPSHHARAEASTGSQWTWQQAWAGSAWRNAWAGEAWQDGSSGREWTDQGPWRQSPSQSTSTWH